MNMLIEEIKNKYKFFEPDIELNDFLDDIKFNEYKSLDINMIEENINSIKTNNKNKIIGYILLKSYILYKCYFISLSNNDLYVAFENIIPKFWIKINSIDDIKNIKQIYNNKNSSFNNEKLLFIKSFTDKLNIPLTSNILETNDDILSFLKDISEYSVFTSSNISSEEIIYKISINYNKFNCIEKAIINKSILNNNTFYIKTIYSQSIIQFESINKIIYLKIYFNKDINYENGLPIDLNLFLTNFNFETIENILDDQNSNILSYLINSMNFKNYSIMYDSIKNFFTNKILEKTEFNYDNEFINILKYIYTNLLVNIIIDKKHIIDNIKYETNDKLYIHSLIKNEMDEIDKKIYVDEHFKKMKFERNNINEKID